MRRRTVGFSRVLALLAGVAIGVSPGDGGLHAAQGLQQSRITTVNGRQILEIRMGIVPGNSSLRTLVVTSGPVAGSTSLLASSVPASEVTNPATPMLFSVVVNSGSLFSLGGGCARAGELNFPYIDGLQFRIVRYTGTTQTIVTPPAVAGQFEGVNCTTSANGQAVYYALANRTTGRLEVWRELAGNAFTRIHAGTRTLRLPFNGGVRPQISRMFRRPPIVQAKTAMPEGFDSAATPYEVEAVLAMSQNSSGTIFVDVIDALNGGDRGVCSVATRTAGSPPFEAVLTPDYVVGDFDGNGNAEIRSLGPTLDGLCEVGSRNINKGSAAGGNGYAWTGYALAGNTINKNYRVLNGGGSFFLDPTTVTSSASPFAGRGGPFHAAYLGSGEFAPGILAVGAATPNTLLEFVAWAPAQETGFFSSSFEPPIRTETLTIEVAPPPR